MPTLPWREFWRELWRLTAPFRRIMRLIFALTLVIAVVDLSLPYILKLAVDGLYDFENIDLSFLLWLIVLYFSADQFRSILQFFNDRAILKLSLNIYYDFAVQAQSKLLDLSLGYHESENTGSKIAKIDRGIDRIAHLSENINWEVLPTLIQITFTVAALFWADWRIGLSFLFFAPSFIYLTYWSNRRMLPVRKEIYRSYEAASGKMGQAIININAVQSFVQEGRELSEYEKIKKRIYDNGIIQWGWMLKVGLGRNLVSNIGRGSVLFLGVYLVYTGSMTIGTLIFAFTLSEKAYSAMFRLTRFYDRIEEGREGVSRLLLLLKTQSFIQNRKGALTINKMIGSFEFKDVTFKYKGAKLKAINKVSFKVSAGSIVAFVGPSGGGKTTVARLLYRHYDPTSGKILVDGQDIKNYDLTSYRRFLAIVPQEVEIFDLSIRENIAYAKPNASEEEIAAAARIANAEEFIVKLEKGYETMVGERGIKLSGGQRQRIGIARAILADPRILIFDEATSNLDSQSERLIQEALARVGRNRTVLIIAHRLSTIQQANKIIVLENGKLIEQGNHASLMRVNGGLYSKLIKLQEVGDLR